MDSFFTGFADELVKLGAAGSLASPRPGEIKTLKPNSSAPPASNQQRPSNAHGPTSEALRAVPQQQIKTWGTKKQDTWQASPRYKPTAVAKKPEEPVKKPGKGKGNRSSKPSGPVDGRFPGESLVAYNLRRSGEKADWKKEQINKGKVTEHSRNTAAEKAFKADPVQRAKVKQIPSVVNRGGTISPNEDPIIRNPKKMADYQKQQAWNRKEIDERIKDARRGPAPAIDIPKPKQPKSSPTTRVTPGMGSMQGRNW